LCFLLPALIYCQENRFALVIGNSNYQYGASLANPVNDAEDIGEKLKTAGFDVSQYVDLSLTEMIDLVIHRMTSQYNQNVNDWIEVLESMNQ